MIDYQKMYYIICSAASKAIDAPPEEAKRILQTALYEAEEIYIRTAVCACRSMLEFTEMT